MTIEFMKQAYATDFRGSLTQAYNEKVAMENNVDQVATTQEEMSQGLTGAPEGTSMWNNYYC